MRHLRPAHETEIGRGTSRRALPGITTVSCRDAAGFRDCLISSSPHTGALIQGTITQGANSAPAGGVTTSCSSNGQVAPGSCVVTFTANPNNANSFPGLLVPGAATFTLQFYQNGTVLDTKSVAITLMSP